jgi:aminoglycoside phosphotransferase (APT) family kinase protein
MNPVWQLTADNAVEYLRQRGWLSGDPAHAEELAGGVSNLVLRVLQGERRIVVKQSRSQLRTRDAWFSDLERIHREEDVMRLLAPLLPAGAVPRVLFADRERFVLGMEHAPEPSRSWKQMLLAGEVDAAVGERAGRILGAIHEATARRRDELHGLLDREVFVQLRVEPFYRRIQERRPEVAGLVTTLIDEMMTAREALCHGDFSPKNLLVHEGGLTLVDYETGHLGEPAMDLGFFFSHLLLKRIRAGNDGRIDDVVRAAWRGYAAEVQYTPAACVLRRGMRHLGACMLARIDGTSPVDYLPGEAQRDTARRLGRWLLGGGAAGLDEALQRLESDACPPGSGS